MTGHNNYFSVRTGKTTLTFHFADDDYDDTMRAFELADAACFDLEDRVSVYAVPQTMGPWDRVALIGHRTRSAIQKDLGEAVGVSKANFEVELEELDRAYEKVGRKAPGLRIASAA